jgi:hypothetical protein
MLCWPQAKQRLNGPAKTNRQIKANGQAKANGQRTVNVQQALLRPPSTTCSIRSRWISFQTAFGSNTWCTSHRT